MSAETYIRSIPALAAHLRSVHRMRVRQSSALACPATGLVHTYRPALPKPNGTPESTLAALHREADAMQHVFRRLIDLLHRLAIAFREWPEFDPGAYFNLYPHQEALLVRLLPHTRSTRVVFQGDLLIPGFQRAEAYFVNTFTPAYTAAFPPTGITRAADDAMRRYRHEVEPEMARRWQHLVTVARRLNWSLQDDLDFLVISHGEEELFDWRPAWRQDAAPGLHLTLNPAWETLTTFTLSIRCETSPLHPFHLS